ncbi:MAG: FUSC family protein [Mycoplasmatales bacterium]
MRHIHGLGPRTMKTSLAIFICIALNNLLNSFGVQTVGFYAAISVIFTMQVTLPLTMTVGIHRMLGTALGGVVAVLVFYLQSILTPDFLDAIYVTLAIMLTFYLCTRLKITLGIPTAGIIIISSFTMLPSDNLVFFITLRVLETIFGVLLAMLINKYLWAPKTDIVMEGR